MNKSPKIIGYTIATRYDAKYVVIRAIILFVARSGCFYEDNHQSGPIWEISDLARHFLVEFGMQLFLHNL